MFCQEKTKASAKLSVKMFPTWEPCCCFLMCLPKPDIKNVFGKGRMKTNQNENQKKIQVKYGEKKQKQISKEKIQNLFLF